jgi:hypothetical protein
MPMPIFGQTDVTSSPQPIPEARPHHLTPVPCKNNKVKTDYQIQAEANLGTLSSKGFLQNSKTSGIFSLTHPTRSLRRGVWFQGCPLSKGDSRGAVSANSHVLAILIIHGISNLIGPNQHLTSPPNQIGTIEFPINKMILGRSDDILGEDNGEDLGKDELGSQTG